MESEMVDLSSISLPNLAAMDLNRPTGLSCYESDPEEVFLPPGVVKQIAVYLVLNEAPGNALVNLLAMCGVCRQWRNVAKEVNEGMCLGFDGLDSNFPTQGSVSKFKRLSHQQKEYVFTKAAKLFVGYTEVNFSGEGVTDQVLEAIASSAGSKLQKVKIQSASFVTDKGLGALVSSAPNLESLVLDELMKATSGTFLVEMFQHCKKLKNVHLSNMPQLSWGPCKVACSQGDEIDAVNKLHVRNVNLDNDFGAVVSCLPSVTEVELDGPPKNIKAAALSCADLVRVSFCCAARPHLDEALAALMNIKGLKQLELVIKNFILTSEQLRVIGSLPVTELRLDSYIYKQQPSLSRSSYSHMDNEGVKALVDAICNRWSAANFEMKPLKLSLCGATALTHDAVSALLRLPVLTELDIGGCCKITAMDKMRLVAKVRAGREMLESGRKPTIRSLRFPGLVF